jgi:hypothetical protein
MPFERRIARQKWPGFGRFDQLALEHLNLAFESRDVPALLFDLLGLPLKFGLLLSTFVLPVPLLRGLRFPTSEQNRGHDPPGRLEEFGPFDP